MHDEARQRMSFRTKGYLGRAAVCLVPGAYALVTSIQNAGWAAVFLVAPLVLLSFMAGKNYQIAVDDHDSHLPVDIDAAQILSALQDLSIHPRTDEPTAVHTQAPLVATRVTLLLAELAEDQEADGCALMEGLGVAVSSILNNPHATPQLRKAFRDGTLVGAGLHTASADSF